MTRDQRKQIAFILEIIRTICAIGAVTLTAIWVLYQLGYFHHR